MPLMRKAYKISTMRSPAKLVTPLAVIAALILSTLTSIAGIAPAQALSFDSVPAGWAYTYAAKYAAPNSAHSASITKSPVLNEKHATAKSTFIVTYTGVPEIEMPAIQAALDAWSNDYASTIPIHVEASFTRQGFGGILAYALPMAGHGIKTASPTQRRGHETPSKPRPPPNTLTRKPASATLSITKCQLVPYGETKDPKTKH